MITEEQATEESREMHDPAAHGWLLRRRRRRIVLLLVALIGGAGVVGTLIGWKPKRQEFVGKVHSSSGIHCRLTLSAEWRVVDFGKGMPYNAPERYAFVAPPPGAIQLWIDRYLRHSPRAESPVLYLRSHSTKTLPSYLQLREGYPESGAGRLMRTHRHLRIDGYCATLIEVDPRFPGELGQALLMVYVPEQELFYVLGGSVRLDSADFAYREMQRVFVSFHIEKPAVPAILRAHHSLAPH